MNSFWAQPYGKFILFIDIGKDVTSDRRYSNSNLSQNTLFHSND